MSAGRHPLEDLGMGPSLWKGTILTNVTAVYLTFDGPTRTGKQPHVKTPGGVYMWPNGYVTCYVEKGNVNAGVIYPPERIQRLEFS